MKPKFILKTWLKGRRKLLSVERMLKEVIFISVFPHGMRSTRCIGWCIQEARGTLQHPQLQVHSARKYSGLGRGGVAAPCSYLLWLSVPPLNQLRCLPGSCRGIFALRHSCTRCNTTHNSAKPTSRPIKCDRNIATGSSGPGSSFIYFAFFSTEIKVTHMIE